LSRVRVKICGIRDEQDVLGNLSLKAADRLMKRVPKHVKKVVVTTMRTRSDYEEMLPFLLGTLEPDMVQLHGHELSISASIRRDFAEVKFIRALSIRDESCLAEGLAMSKAFDGIHADSCADGLNGGTGNTHNWKLSARVRDLIDPTPLTLAGGLSPENVEEAIRVVHPFAVDVSTGVERSPGVKDHDRIFEFVKRAKGVTLS
jgi:phosphoribosylanthranilate isomerase